MRICRRLSKFNGGMLPNRGTFVMPAMYEDSAEIPGSLSGTLVKILFRISHTYAGLIVGRLGSRTVRRRLFARGPNSQMLSLHCCTLSHVPNRMGHNTWRKASDTCGSDQPHHDHQCLRAGRACISKGTSASMHFPNRYMAAARNRSSFSAGSPYNKNSGVHAGDLRFLKND